MRLEICKGIEAAVEVDCNGSSASIRSSRLVLVLKLKGGLKVLTKISSMGERMEESDAVRNSRR